MFSPSLPRDKRDCNFLAFNFLARVSKRCFKFVRIRMSIVLSLPSKTPWSSLDPKDSRIPELDDTLSSVLSIHSTWSPDWRTHWPFTLESRVGLSRTFQYPSILDSLTLGTESFLALMFCSETVLSSGCWDNSTPTFFSPYLVPHGNSTS